MTDAKLNSILDDGATDEESIDRLKEGESVVQKDLVTSLTDSIVDSIKSDGSSTPKPSKEVLKGSLSGLYSSDPEMARALEEVLDDPEVAGMLDSMDRINGNTASQADIDLFANPLPDHDGSREPSIAFDMDAVTGIDGNFIGGRVSTLYDHLNRFKKTAKYVDLVKATAGDAAKKGLTGAQKGLYYSIDYFTGGRFDAEEHLNAPSGKYVTYLKEHGAGIASDAFSTTTTLASVGLSGYGLYSGISQVQDGEELDGGLAIAASSLGLAKVTYQLTKTISAKMAAKMGPGVTQDVLKVVGGAGIDAGTQMSKRATAFAFGVGSALAVAAGAVSITQNALAAKDAFDSNQDAVGALYSVMVALDAVSLALDVTSLAMDFVPGIGQAISVVLDLINLGIAGINIGLSFVVGLVIDNGQRHRDAWDAYLNSDAFKSYMNDLSDSFRKEGYDSLTVIVDSTSAGVPDYGTGDNLESWQKRTLTERARRLPDSKDLRLAILDQSLSGHTLMGRDNDDYIDGGKGKDIIYGHGGDDILLGGTGDDRIFGGKGDDYIDGGLGHDYVDAGPGDDRIVVEVGIDTPVIGGKGNDTIELATGFAELNKKTITQHVDLSKGKANVSTSETFSKNINDYVGYNRRNRNVYDLTIGQQYVRKEDKNYIYFAAKQSQFHDDTDNFGHAKNVMSGGGYQLIRRNWYHDYKGHITESKYYYNMEEDKLVVTLEDPRYSSSTNRSKKYYGQMEYYSVVNNFSRFAYEWLVNLEDKSPASMDGYDKFACAIAARHGKLNTTIDLNSIENVVGSNVTDYITGNDNDNFLDGGENAVSGQHDVLKGKGGDDSIVIHHMKDVADGGEGKDTLVIKNAKKGDNVTFNMATKRYIVAGKHDRILQYENFEQYVMGDANHKITGSDGDEIIRTGSSTNTVNAGDGNDTLIAARDSVNTFNGEGGNDLFILTRQDLVQQGQGESTTTANGGAGDDVFYGGSSEYTIDGGEGFDRYIYTGEGTFFLDLEKIAPIEVFSGALEVATNKVTGIESFRGGKQRDILKGDENNNIFNGGGLIDGMSGRAGNDLFVVDTILDSDYNEIKQGQSRNWNFATYDGGRDNDTVNYEGLDYSTYKADDISGFTINLGGAGSASGDTRLHTSKGDKIFHKLKSVENAVGTRGNDTIHGTSADNVLNGFQGTDHIYGYGGNDTLNALSGTLEGGEGHDTYLISGDARNLIINDLDMAHADRLVFDGVALDDISMVLEKGPSGKDVLSFQMAEEGETVTLASWILPDGVVTNDSWDPLLKAFASSVYSISFVEAEKEGETGRESVTLETPEDIAGLLYGQLVVVDDPDRAPGGVKKLNDTISDTRGRDVQLKSSETGLIGTAGSDILRAGEKESQGLMYTIQGGEGADLLINSDVKKHTHFYLTENDTLDARLGNGFIYANADNLENTNVILGASSGEYYVNQQATQAAGMNLILDGGTELIKGIQGNRLILSNGNFVQVYSGQHLAFDNIRFTDSQFNDGAGVDIHSREDLENFVQSAVLFEQVRTGELDFGDLSKEDVTLALGKAGDGSDILKFQTEKNGDKLTLVELSLPEGALTDDSWEPLFKAVKSKLKTIQFADDVSLADGDALDEFLYDQLVVVGESDFRNWSPVVVLDEVADDGRGRDYQMLSNQSTLSGTRGDDILRAGNFDRSYVIRGGEGSDRLVNSALADTAFTLTEDDTLDAREGGGSLILSGNKLDDARIILGASSGDYEIYANASSSNLNLILDGDTSLVKGISDNKLMLSGGGSIELFDRNGKLIIDSVQFTQGDYNSGEPIELSGREDLEHFVETAVLYEQMSDGELHFSNTSMDDVKLLLVKADDGSDVLRFQTERNGKTITLVDMPLPEGALTNDSWDPLFEAVTGQMKSIQFAQGTTLNTDEAIEQFLHDQLVVVTGDLWSPYVRLGSVKDRRGRECQLQGNQYLLKGTKGDDILIAGTKTFKTYMIGGGEGKDLLVNTSAAGMRNPAEFGLTNEDTLDGRVGHGSIFVQGWGGKTHANVILGADSGNYNFDPDFKHGDMTLSLIMEGDIDLIDEVEDNHLILANGSKVELFNKNGRLVYDSIEFTRGDFNDGNPLDIHSREDLVQLIDSVNAQKQMDEIGVGSLTDVAMDEVRLQLGTDSGGVDVLKFQINKDGAVSTLGEIALSKEAVASDSWTPVFEEALAQLGILQFAQGETIKTEADMEQFLYDRLVVTGPGNAYSQSTVGDYRGRDRTTHRRRQYLYGTEGSDILRVGSEVYAHSNKGFTLRGGEGSDLLVNAEVKRRTGFTVTEGDIVDGRSGSGFFEWSVGNRFSLKDTTVVLGKDSGTYSIDCSSYNKTGMNLILDGNVDLLDSIDGNWLNLDGGGKVAVIADGYLAFDSIQFTQGGFNNGQAFKINNRSDLDKLVDEIAAFKASSDDISDYTTTDSTYHISHPLADKGDNELRPLILDGDIDVISSVEGRDLVLSDGARIKFFDKDGQPVYGSVEFSRGTFNGGDGVVIDSREDLQMLIDSADQVNRRVSLNANADDVLVTVEKNTDGQDILYFKARQGDQAVDLKSIELPGDGSVSDSWTPVFEAINQIRFADGQKLATKEAVHEYLYDHLVKGASANFDYGVDNGITDSRGRDVLLGSEQYDLVGTQGADILRVGEGTKEKVLYGGEGSDLLVNTKRNVPTYRTKFYVTSDDIVDGRSGSGNISYLNSRADLSDTTVVLGQSSGKYTTFAYTGIDLDMNLVLDGNVDLIRNISGDYLNLTGGGRVNLFESGHQTFDSIQFTQGDFNNGEAFEVNNRSDLDKLVEQIAAFKASSDDSSDFTTTDSTYQISHPLNNLSASSIV